MTVEELKGFAGGLGVTANHTITQIKGENAQKSKQEYSVVPLLTFSTPVWVG